MPPHPASPRQAAALTRSRLRLRQETARRKAAEAALARNAGRHQRMLARSDRLQEQLRCMSRLIISTQEDERRRISRELHDVVGQTLAGISVRLATLGQAARLNGASLARDIARTQQLVTTSVDLVHRFARDLRPAELDDLGLVPALRAHLAALAQRTSLRTRLHAGADADAIDAPGRTALFRVAQEALTNVTRHAQAAAVRITLHRAGDQLRMVIRDDGKSFSGRARAAGAGRPPAGPARHAGAHGHGRRPARHRFGTGHGTTITATIPLRTAGRKRRRTHAVQHPAGG